MKRRLPRHVVEEKHGTSYRFRFKRKGYPKVTLPGLPWTPEFMAAYARALNGEAPVAPAAAAKAAGVKTLGWLCARYTSSPEFRELDPSTQRTRRNLIERMLEEPVVEGEETTFREFPLDRLTPKAVKVLRDRKEGAKTAGNQRIKTLRVVFGWGMENEAEEVKANPAREVKRFRYKSDGHHTWTPEEVFAFIQRHPVGTMACLALSLMLFTGCRRSDVVLLGRQHISLKRDPADPAAPPRPWLHYTQHKNRNVDPVTLDLPVLPTLQAIIDATPKTAHLAFLTSGWGVPFASGNAFGNWFADRCREAGVPGRAHGLRKAGATIATENGATVQQLMAIFGWTNEKQAMEYVKKARQRKLAGAAMHLIALPSPAAAIGEGHD
jgi:integrase